MATKDMLTRISLAFVGAVLTAAVPAQEIATEPAPDAAGDLFIGVGEQAASVAEAELDADRPTVLITGSNRGIGLGFAEHYALSGWNVIATARSPGEASALHALAAQSESARVVIEELDVLDANELERLSSKYASVHVDLLINNAAFHGGDPHDRLLGSYDFSTFERYMSVNVFGPLAVSEAFVDSVAASRQKRIVTLTTGLASLTRPSPMSCLAFQGISKAAVNKAMRTLQVALEPRGITVALISPGAVDTDGLAAARRAFAPCVSQRPAAFQAEAELSVMSVAESVAATAEVIAGLDESYDGSHLDYQGHVQPW